MFNHEINIMSLFVFFQVMLGGKNIEEGFGIAYRVIQVKYNTADTQPKCLLVVFNSSPSLPASGLPASGPGGLRAGRPKARPTAAAQSRTSAAQVCRRVGHRHQKRLRRPHPQLRLHRR